MHPGAARSPRASRLAWRYPVRPPRLLLPAVGPPHRGRKLYALSEDHHNPQHHHEREHEDIKDTVPATEAPLTGVPEPEEWLLIGLAVAMLLWYANRQRLAGSFVKGRSSKLN